MYRELLGAYALDAVTRDEELAISAHLEECDSCRAEVARLRSVVNALPLTVEEMEPPPSLRTSILAAVERRLEVTSSKPVTGAWHWFADNEVHYRPKSYWPMRRSGPSI